MWFGTFPEAGRPARLAALLEAEGWDGLALTDSQSLAGDVFVGLALAAHATRRLKLATGATNLSTRHPAVVASAIATVQAESFGRAVLGVARGDSALAYLGRPPQPLAGFGAGLGQLQTYLRGDAVNLEGYASRIDWLAASRQAKVPVSVAATGPRIIGLAARLAERVTFSVGAQPERLQWAMQQARTARSEAGLDPTGVRLGAYVNAVAHPNVERARELVRGRLGVYARFASMHQNALHTLTEADRAEVQRLAGHYNMAQHGTATARHAEELDAAFIDRFGIAGPSELVADRLLELRDIGLDHLIVVGHGRDASFEVLAESIRRFGREVIPRLK
ncbi:MAG TPA: LLM class flavin-dependent oxidoreductase [Chloroflexota bacterium]|nr:LLM class flavin-dependent oxidoreductase [Chloroflexota bacterium]